MLTSGLSEMLRDQMMPPLSGPKNLASDTVDWARPLASGTYAGGVIALIKICSDECSTLAWVFRGKGPRQHTITAV